MVYINVIFIFPVLDKRKQLAANFFFYLNRVKFEKVNESVQTFSKARLTPSKSCPHNNIKEYLLLLNFVLSRTVSLVRDQRVNLTGAVLAKFMLFWELIRKIILLYKSVLG